MIYFPVTFYNNFDPLDETLYEASGCPEYAALMNAHAAAASDPTTFVCDGQGGVISDPEGFVLMLESQNCPKGESSSTGGPSCDCVIILTDDDGNMIGANVNGTDALIAPPEDIDMDYYLGNPHPHPTDEGVICYDLLERVSGNTITADMICVAVPAAHPIHKDYDMTGDCPADATAAIAAIPAGVSTIEGSSISLNWPDCSWHFSYESGAWVDTSQTVKCCHTDQPLADTVECPTTLAGAIANLPSGTDWVSGDTVHQNYAIDGCEWKLAFDGTNWTGYLLTQEAGGCCTYFVDQTTNATCPENVAAAVANVPSTITPNVGDTIIISYKTCEAYLTWNGTDWTGTPTSASYIKPCCKSSAQATVTGASTDNSGAQPVTTVNHNGHIGSDTDHYVHNYIVGTDNVSTDADGQNCASLPQFSTATVTSTYTNFAIKNGDLHYEDIHEDSTCASPIISSAVKRCDVIRWLDDQGNPLACPLPFSFRAEDGTNINNQAASDNWVAANRGPGFTWDATTCTYMRIVDVNIPRVEDMPTTTFLSRNSTRNQNNWAAEELTPSGSRNCTNQLITDFTDYEVTYPLFLAHATERQQTSLATNLTGAAVISRDEHFRVPFVTITVLNGVATFNWSGSIITDATDRTSLEALITVLTPASAAIGWNKYRIDRVLKGYDFTLNGTYNFNQNNIGASYLAMNGFPVSFGHGGTRHDEGAEIIMVDAMITDVSSGICNGSSSPVNPQELVFEKFIKRIKHTAVAGYLSTTTSSGNLYYGRFLVDDWNGRRHSLQGADSPTQSFGSHVNNGTPWVHPLTADWVMDGVANTATFSPLGLSTNRAWTAASGNGLNTGYHLLELDMGSNEGMTRKVRVLWHSAIENPSGSVHVAPALFNRPQIPWMNNSTNFNQKRYLRLNNTVGNASIAAQTSRINIPTDQSHEAWDTVTNSKRVERLNGVNTAHYYTPDRLAIDCSTRHFITVNGATTPVTNTFNADTYNQDYVMQEFEIKIVETF